MDENLQSVCERRNLGARQNKKLVVLKHCTKIKTKILDALDLYYVRGLTSQKQFHYYIRITKSQASFNILDWLVKWVDSKVNDK